MVIQLKTGKGPKDLTQAGDLNKSEKPKTFKAISRPRGAKGRM